MNKPDTNQLPITSLRVNYAIGIDADIEKSGFAVWKRDQALFTTIESVPFWKLLDYINRFQAGEAVFYVDAGWLNGGYFHGLPENFKTWHDNAKQAYLIKRGIDVGRNFGVGQSIVGYLRAHGHEVVEVKPVGQKNAKLKWDAEKLKQLTGWSKRTNEDARDAARLCFQR